MFIAFDDLEDATPTGSYIFRNPQGYKYFTPSEYF
jgi:hypothetical protein